MTPPDAASDIVIVRTNFVIDGDYSDPERLEKLARSTFHELHALTIENLPLEDFGLIVRFAEGSLAGKTRVIAGAAAVFAFIAQYGGLRSGVDYLARDGERVARQIMEKDPLKSEARKSSGSRVLKADAGTMSEIKKILDRVSQGHLTSEEGGVLIKALLEKENVIVSQEIEHLIDEGVEQAPRQLAIPSPLSDAPISQSPKPRREKPPPSKAAHWIVEVKSRHREEKPTVKRRLSH